MNEIVTKMEPPAPTDVTSPADSILAVIERAAQNPDVDIDKMERLFALREQALNRQAEAAFNEAMRHAQSEIKLTTRTKRNEQTESNYADITAVNESVMPVATKYGFSVSFGTAECPLDGYMRVTATVSHAAGHSRAFQADVPTDATGIKGTTNKTKTHAFGSTMTYGRRYLLLLIFNVSTADDDGNASSAKETIITEELIQELKETGQGRAESGTAALESWWKKELTRQEINALMHDLSRLKGIAKDADKTREGKNA